MVTTQTNVNRNNQIKRGSLDTSAVTVKAFNEIRKMQNQTDYMRSFNVSPRYNSSIQGRDAKTGEAQGKLKSAKITTNSAWESTPVHKVRVKVITNQDGKEHTYFHSMSIDAQVTDFLHTCELRCPFNWDLMEYWEPIRQSCAVYGTNQGDYKLLFVGRVRELIQDGYELSITLQNYGWKFKQDVPEKLVKDAILNNNGLDIMITIFRVLKIESFDISAAAQERLKKVGLNDEGTLVSQGEEVEEIPDLLERLKESNPKKHLSNAVVAQKARESQLYNIDDINYTLKYEEDSEELKEISSRGTGLGNQIASSQGKIIVNIAPGTFVDEGECIAPEKLFANIKSSEMIDALKKIYLFNHDCLLAYPNTSVLSYALENPALYNSQIKPVLNQIANVSKRKDRRNGGKEIMDRINNIVPHGNSQTNSIISGLVNSAIKSFTNG